MTRNKKTAYRFLGVLLAVMVGITPMFASVQPSYAKAKTAKATKQAKEVEREVTVSTYITSTKDLDIDASGAIIYDGDTGEVLFGRNIDKAYDPLSMTKVMTALLVMEEIEAGRMSLEDYAVTTKEDTKGPESKLGLKKGEKIKIKWLLAAALIESENDAAAVLGSAVAGNKTAFAEKMNQRARELGCTNTHFKNANGLLEDDLYSTPADMALIAKSAFRFSYIRKICTTKKMKIPGTKKHKDGWVVRLTNPFFSVATKKNKPYKTYNIKAGKTGTWDISNASLMEMSTYKGHTIYTVVMHSPLQSRYTDTVKLLKYARGTYDERQAMEENLARKAKEKEERHTFIKEINQYKYVQKFFGWVNQNYQKSMIPVQKAYKTTNQMVSITWDQKEGVEGYIVFRSVDGGKYQQVKLLSSPEETNFVDERVEKNHIYKYFVRGYKMSKWLPYMR